MARNVIDSLVVELGLDPSKFTRGQRQAVEQFKQGQRELTEAAKKTEDVARRNSETMSIATQKILGFIGAFAGVRAITNFTTALVRNDDELGRSAKLIETNARELAIWRQVMQAAGGTAEDATGTFSSLMQEFQRFSITGQGGNFIKWFRAAQVEITEMVDGVEKVRPFRDIMLEMSAFLSKMGSAKAFQFGIESGISPGMTQFLLMGPQKMREMLKTQEGLVSVTEADTKAARELAQAWTEATQAANAFAGELTRGVYPILTKILQTTAFILSWWRTPEGRAKAAAQGEAGDKEIRRRFGTPAQADEWLRGVFGGKGEGPFSQLSRALSGEGASAAGTSGSAGVAPPSDLRVKPGAGMDRTHAGVQALARSIQDDIPGINRFTSGNDAFHAGRPSAHNRGLAMDFTVKNRNEAGAIAEQVRTKLKALGINATVIDEYSRPSPFSSGGHIHVQFGSEADAQKYAGARGSLNGAMRAAPAGAARAGMAGDGGVTSSTSNQNSSVTTIGKIDVVTQATDAPGIARDIRGAIEREGGGIAAQANSGPN